MPRALQRIAILAAAVILIGGTAIRPAQTSATTRSALSPGVWVAMGDSYQAGVGAVGTEEKNACSRSPLAYAPVLHSEGVGPDMLLHIACSGAKIDNLRSPYGGEEAQMEVLGDTADVTLATAGIGGNDLDFSTYLVKCILGGVVNRSCAQKYEQNIEANFDAITTPDSTGHTKLGKVYEDMSNAGRQVIVVSYPKFFVPTTNRCNFVTSTDQIWIDNWINQLDSAIDQIARAEGVDSLNLYNASQGHEICACTYLPYLNGIVTFSKHDSFHPTEYGYSETAELLKTYIRVNFASPRPRTKMGIAGVDREVVVPAHGSVRVPVKLTGGPGAGFTTHGESIRTRLIDPTGRSVGNGETVRSIAHSRTSKMEHYSVGNPATGNWTMVISSTDDEPKSQLVRVMAAELPKPRPRPTARIFVHQHGSTIDLSAGPSRSNGARIVRYQWDLGDGSSAEGMTLRHAYRKPGAYTVGLVVTDEHQMKGFAVTSRRIVIPR